MTEDFATKMRKSHKVEKQFNQVRVFFAWFAGKILFLCTFLCFLCIFVVILYESYDCIS